MRIKVNINKVKKNLCGTNKKNQANLLIIWIFYLNNSSLLHKHAVTALNEHKIAPHALPVLQATQAGLDVIAHNQFARHLNMEYGYQM